MIFIEYKKIFFFKYLYIYRERDFISFLLFYFFIFSDEISISGVGIILPIEDCMEKRKDFPFVLISSMLTVSMTTTFILISPSGFRFRTFI